MKIPFKKQVPPSTYKAIFSGVEMKKTEYGDAVSWNWHITAGPWRGELISRLTTMPASARNAAGKFAAALTGLPADQAVEKDLDSYAGTPCLIVVALSESGYSRVESFVPETPPEVAETKSADEIPF
jgi:hypothetical protein